MSSTDTDLRSPGSTIRATIHAMTATSGVIVRLGDFTPRSLAADHQLVSSRRRLGRFRAGDNPEVGLLAKPW